MATAPTPAHVDPVRQQLVQAILGTGADQQTILTHCPTTGSKTASDVLSAWTRGGSLSLCRARRFQDSRHCLEDQQDADGKARAIRIIDGQFVKDASGKELRFADGDLNTADTDMRLRSSIQQTLDTLALSDPDPDARYSAVTKLGNSHKESYIPILQRRLAMEKNGEVKKAIDEAIATLQLERHESGRADRRRPASWPLSIHRQPGQPERISRAGRNDNPQLQAEIQRAVASINGHIGWVNFYGTIFHGLSLGSILLVVALGLAITFGLMGVINMAHGEMIAVGAYTTYVIQNLFGSGFDFPHHAALFHFRRAHCVWTESARPQCDGLVLSKLFYLCDSVELHHGGTCRPGAGTLHHPVSLSPAARIAPRHLGRFARHAADVPHGFRREQCAGQFAQLAARPFHRSTTFRSATTAFSSSALRS